MELDQVRALIAEGESEVLELKRSTAQLRRAGETLCAFLNGKGGTVVVGVTAAGELVGQDVADKTRRDVASMIREFEPPAPIEVEYVELPESDRKLILFTVSGGGAYLFRGRAYERIETTTVAMQLARLQQLLVDRAPAKHRWDSQPAPDWTLDDLDHEEIRKTLQAGARKSRLPSPTGDETPGEILERLGLIEGGRLLNAAVVLFARDPFPDLPQCGLRMARFRGTSVTGDFIDNRQLHGHAFHLLDEAMLFLGRHIPIAGHVPPDSLVREDTPLYPFPALREALVNAICHRSYRHYGGAVSIAIYDDRLEIWSDGTLPFGLRPEDLKRDHRSMPRNELIAATFYKRGLIEKWGRGTQTIVELCVQAGQPEPEFFEQAGCVVVRFFPRVVQGLSKRQRAILEILASGKEVPFRDIRKRLSQEVSDRTLRRDLADLKAMKLIELRGRGRGAAWVLCAP